MEQVLRKCINCGEDVIFKQVGTRRVPVNADNEKLLHYDNCKGQRVWWWGAFVKENKEAIRTMFPNRG